MHPLSICIISREYPPDSNLGGIAPVTQMESRALAALGHVVHVITLAGPMKPGTPRVYADHGVIVHRLVEVGVSADVMRQAPYMQAGAWSMRVAQEFARLDARVRFDVVQAPEYYAEMLHVQTRPQTLRVARLHMLTATISKVMARPDTPGRRGFEALEHGALSSAHLVLAPTRLVEDAARSELPEGTRESMRWRLLPPYFDCDAFPVADPPARRDGRLRLVFVGRVEVRKGPDLAVRALAEAHAAGCDCELEIVGRDSGDEHGRPLVPQVQGLADRLGVGDRVRFTGQVDRDEIACRVVGADALILPSRWENSHTAALEGLAAGVPVIAREPNGLTCWLGDDEGLMVGPHLEDEFAAWAAARIAEIADRDHGVRVRDAARAGARMLRERMSPLAVAGDQVDGYLEAIRELDMGPSARAVEDGPSIGVIMLAHNQLEYTRTAVASVLRTSPAATRIYLVDNASTDATADWAAAHPDERVVHVRSETNAGVSGGRNIGLDAALPAGHEFVCFLDNDVECHPGWWQPLVDALQARPQAAIAGQRGVRLRFTDTGRDEHPLDLPVVSWADMVVGFCMMMRADVIGLIGRFDESLGLFWHDDDDYGLRARRLGFEVLHVGHGLVEHYEHKSSSVVEGIWDAVEQERPSDLSARNQRYLAARTGFYTGLASDLPGSRPVSVVAWADELLADRSLIEVWNSAVQPETPATLAVYTADPLDEESVRELEEAGLGGGGDVLVVAPELAFEEVASVADAVLSRRDHADGALHAAPHVDDREMLAEVIARRLARIEALAAI